MGQCQGSIALFSLLMILGPGQPPLKSLFRREWRHPQLVSTQRPAGHWEEADAGLNWTLARCNQPDPLLVTGRASLDAVHHTPVPSSPRGGCPGNSPGTEDVGASGAGRGCIHWRPGWGPRDAGLCLGRDGRLSPAHPGGQTGPCGSRRCREPAEAGPGGWQDGWPTRQGPQEEGLAYIHSSPTAVRFRTAPGERSGVALAPQVVRLLLRTMTPRSAPVACNFP